MKKLYFLPVFLLLTGLSFGQYTQLPELLDIARTTNYGTARSMAMGGAFGALGGDLSSLSTNPAGIGVFRKSEISMTPSLQVANTKSGGRSKQDASFQLGDFGGVFAFYSPNFDWKGINFAINYTNLNNFNRKTDQFVNNSLTSLLQVLGRYADGTPPQDLDVDGIYGNTVQALAYQTYLINPIPNDPDSPDEQNFYNPWYGYGNPTNQKKYIKENGYQGEYAISFGTNYKDKLYLGVTIGIQDLHYDMKSVYTESVPDNDLEYYDYEEGLKINGVGTNFKMGVIYRPIPEIRIGAAVHTPTFYSITEKFYNGFYSQFRLSPDPENTDDATRFSSYTDPTSYSYDLKTPWKAIFSLASVIRQKAIVSLDYEYANFSTIRLSNGEDGQDFYSVDGGVTPGMNDDIKYFLKAVHNFRAGVEYRFNSMFSLRGGYNLLTSPTSRYTSLDYKIQSFSAGFGFNFGVFYVDGAFLHKWSQNTTRFYDYLDYENSIYDAVAEPVKNKKLANEGRITLGVRF